MFGISNSRKSLLFWSALALVLGGGLVFLYFKANATYLQLGAEDALGENLTAIFYAVAGGLLLLTAGLRLHRGARLHTQTLTLLLALFFIFVAGEEISWGQRILGLHTPDVIAKNNVQGEFNFHNLSFFDRNKALLNQHTALNAFALLMGVLIPLAHRFVPPLRRLLDVFHFPVPATSVCMIFVVGLVHGQTLAKMYPHYSHAEVKELIFSIGFLLSAIGILSDQMKSRTGDAEAGVAVIMEGTKSLVADPQTRVS